VYPKDEPTWWGEGRKREEKREFANGSSKGGRGKPSEGEQVSRNKTGLKGEGGGEQKKRKINEPNGTKPNTKQQARDLVNLRNRTETSPRMAQERKGRKHKNGGRKTSKKGEREN